MVFLISSHLVARKEQEGENCCELAKYIEILTFSIKDQLLVSTFIHEKIREMIES